MTDPDTCLVRSPRGFIQRYDAQAVCTETQVIITADLSVDSPGGRLVGPMVNAASNELAAIGIDQLTGTPHGLHYRRGYSFSDTQGQTRALRAACRGRKPRTRSHCGRAAPQCHATSTALHCGREPVECATSDSPNYPRRAKCTTLPRPSSRRSMISMPQLPASRSRSEGPYPCTFTP